MIIIYSKKAHSNDSLLQAMKKLVQFAIQIVYKFFDKILRFCHIIHSPPTFDTVPFQWSGC